MQKIVVYTPAEDFWYNSDVGSTTLLVFFMFIGAALIGIIASTVFGKRGSNGGAIAGWICGAVSFAIMVKLMFF